MSKFSTLSAIVAVALSLVAVGTHAAPSAKQGVVTLPTVVVTGKAVKQLPTVVVTGYSIEGQLRRQMLAQAAAKPARRG
ncbi:hypothetical protein SNE35_10410 [Paucibacter sp. R3-3]|uniref:Efflux transporter periplasmic adaptor subunit n=1 Tax=Roseateles agri TaxID=3098619 RepID=A0ABU5DF72_9BURK|nr:hypothetical protein [Paucibacter sp. R3-3]MDY0744922.1 hypothetical protein [Paucibacter sp. R3-3]